MLVCVCCVCDRESISVTVTVSGCERDCECAHDFQNACESERESVRSRVSTRVRGMVVLVRARVCDSKCLYDLLRVVTMTMCVKIADDHPKY